MNLTRWEWSAAGYFKAPHPHSRSCCSGRISKMFNFQVSIVFLFLSTPEVEEAGSEEAVQGVGGHTQFRVFCVAASFSAVEPAKTRQFWETGEGLSSGASVQSTQQAAHPIPQSNYQSCSCNPASLRAQMSAFSGNLIDGLTPGFNKLDSLHAKWPPLLQPAPKRLQQRVVSIILLPLQTHCGMLHGEEEGFSLKLF